VAKVEAKTEVKPEVKAEAKAEVKTEKTKVHHKAKEHKAAVPAPVAKADSKVTVAAK
jgi:hypothetical protein